MTTLRDCRMTYIENALQKKEELKGQLEVLLNETIQRIKELKAGQELNEAGLPTDDHANVLETEIAAEITNFNNELADFVATEFTAFFNDGPNASFMTCRDGATTAFSEAYTKDDLVTNTQTGVFPELTTTYEECKTELEAFQDKVEQVLQESIDEYVEDAQLQKNVVATDFFDVLETTLFKIHDGLTDLTDAETETL